MTDMNQICKTCKIFSPTEGLSIKSLINYVGIIRPEWVRRKEETDSLGSSAVIYIAVLRP